MGQTKKRGYDRYTLAFKQQAVRLTHELSVSSKEIAAVLGIHQVMLYRWRMESKRGELRENKNMKPEKASPKRVNKRTDPTRAKQDELVRTQKRIKTLEKQLAQRTEVLDLLKKRSGSSRIKRNVVCFYRRESGSIRDPAFMSHAGCLPNAERPSLCPVR